MAKAEIYHVDFWKQDLIVHQATLEGPYHFVVVGTSLDDAYKHAELQLHKEGMSPDTKDVMQADLWTPNKTKRHRILENGEWRKLIDETLTLEGKV